MPGDVKELECAINLELERVNNLSDLEELRVKTLGKSGSITLLLKQLAKIELEQRKIQGAIYNKLRQDIAGRISAKQAFLKQEEINKILLEDKIDTTLPPAKNDVIRGGIHPISQTSYDMISILTKMGFVMAVGPEIESVFNNFSALNIPEHHPARQDHDTFYLRRDDSLLRTQTSSVQVQAMANVKPPIKIVSPGRVFRSDSDATHVPNFHQIEGLYIAKNVNMSHLKGCLLEFCQKFFNQDDVDIRLRPSYFPFTEPSAEIDIKYSYQNNLFQVGGDCADKWLEVLGCGMIHPNVLKINGIDPEEYQGFAFGMGIERFAMLKYGIPDLRNMYSGDVRWLKHFSFSPFCAF